MKKSELRKIIREEIVNELFGLGKKKVKPFFEEDWNEDKIKGKKLNKEQQLVKNSILEALNKINQKANQKWGVDAKIRINSCSAGIEPQPADRDWETIFN